MLRLTAVCLAIGSLAQLLPSGCPLLSEPIPDDTEPPQPQVSAPDRVAVGEQVELTASVAGADDEGTISYQWYQTYGRVVDLQNANTAAASFVAPQVTEDHTLRFRVDAQNLAGATGNAEAAVTVTGKPSDSSDTAGDGDSSTSGESASDGTSDKDNTSDDTGATSGGTVTETSDEDRVYLITSKGKIVIELYVTDAPLTVKNFQTYVREDFYRGTIFHRITQNEDGEGEIVQGGGYLPGMQYKEPNHSPVPNESDNGLSNIRGTVAMARAGDPDSATSQFFFNLENHSEYDWEEGEPGYTVFGRVVEGMSVLDEIGQVEIDPPGDGAPVNDIAIIRTGFGQ
jgi:cyclophilin family peptidyl-prolyl cis-trans isomerase